jgi:putative aldouronate transport system permease protein
MISVAIIDDHQVLVDALEMFITHGKEFNFLGKANDFRNGKSLLERVRPDVLLLDIGLPDGNGLDLIEEVKKNGANTQVVILTCLQDESTLMRAIDSGVNGFINKGILNALGMDSISWYSNAKYWPVILTLIFLWKSFGYSSILYFATIIGIDKAYYEAAMVDGATVWQQVKRITLPSLKPTIIILVLLQVGRICYSDFGLFYQVPMNSGLLYSTTNTIDTYVYRGLLELNDLGRSTAAGFLQSILGFALVLTANQVVRKLEKDNALF